MAYFSNGSEGMVFDHQCGKCKYRALACPIAFVQLTYNYDQVNNKIATDIMNALIQEDGTCQMYELDPINFFADPNQAKLEL